ncbi:MAG: ABC transporter ATP-binding protein, partial [Bacillota bacterium]|nr:ABC transporter ATP-binding protein [Bacillota bacterium]
MSLKVKNLTFGYDERPVLKDVSFAVEENELLSILGPNGVGKSTLFRCILGLLQGYEGE